MNKTILSTSIASLVIVLSLAACAAPAADAEPTAAPEQIAPERVEITLNEFAIESPVTEFEVGKTYEFVITNEGVIEHEIRIIPPVDADTEDTHGDDEHDEALLVVEAADLQPGESITVEYTFDDHAAEDVLEFACHIAGHYEANMRLPISVE